MSKLILPRRAFLAGLASLVAGPAVVRASSLMPVRRVVLRQLSHDEMVRAMAALLSRQNEILDNRPW